MIFIRIGTKSTSSYTKATTQCNLHVLPPLIKMRQLSRNFLNSISINILETIYWSDNETIHDLEMERCKMCNNSPSICSKSSSIPPDNPPILQSKYPILDSDNISTSTLKDHPLDTKYLNNLLSEVSCVLKDNDIHIYLEKWGGRGKNN